MLAFILSTFFLLHAFVSVLHIWSILDTCRFVPNELKANVTLIAMFYRAVCQTRIPSRRELPSFLASIHTRKTIVHLKQWCVLRHPQLHVIDPHWTTTSHPSHRSAHRLNRKRNYSKKIHRKKRIFAGLVDIPCLFRSSPSVHSLVLSVRFQNLICFVLLYWFAWLVVVGYCLAG